ncbi:hypothetical protein R3P38DRAFT_2775076 [Favolaschia claudopus]|uniref:Uncharacterized protein n=1 Tax=Favolaschia claudopus TaxID=2862362 RepID=A0AAW0BXS5_9AGAR
MSPTSMPSSDTDYSAARRGAECAPPCQLQPRHATDTEAQDAPPKHTRRDDAETRSLIGEISNGVRGEGEHRHNATPTAEDEYDTMLLGLDKALAACDAVQSDCIMRDLPPNYLQTRPPLSGDDPIGDLDALDNGWYLRRSKRLRRRRLQELGRETDALSLVQHPKLLQSTVAVRRKSSTATRRSNAPPHLPNQRHMISRDAFACLHPLDPSVAVDYHVHPPTLSDGVNPPTNTDHSAACHRAECAPPCQLQLRHAIDAEVQRRVLSSRRHDDARIGGGHPPRTATQRDGQVRRQNNTMLLPFKPTLPVTKTSPTLLMTSRIAPQTKVVREI